MLEFFCGPDWRCSENACVRLVLHWMCWCPVSGSSLMLIAHPEFKRQWNSKRNWRLWGTSPVALVCHYIYFFIFLSHQQYSALISHSCIVFIKICKFPDREKMPGFWELEYLFTDIGETECVQHFISLYVHPERDGDWIPGPALDTQLVSGTLLSYTPSTPCRFLVSTVTLFFFFFF